MQFAKVLWIDGSVTPVALMPQVTALNSQSMDLGKVSKTFTKIKQYYPSAMGVVKAPNGSIAFMGDKSAGEYVATIFPGNQKIKGKYQGV